MTLRIASAALAAASALSVSAADFFDTSAPETLFDLGVRIGVNTSNRTVDDGVFTDWNRNAWGTGFDLGAVADINIRDYLAIQPGFFFQTRSGDHAYVTRIPGANDAEFAQVGHSRRYTLNVPVLASFRFNVTDNLRWSVDAGPYVSWIIGHKDDNVLYYPAVPQDVIISGIDSSALPVSKNMNSRSFDFGFKFGTGITVMQHYYFGIHYMAGCLDVWKDSRLGGVNKCWTFSLGYNF